MESASLNPLGHTGPVMGLLYLLYLFITAHTVDLQEVGGSRGDCRELAQDGDRWRALVGTVRNLRGPKMRGIS